jgi:hypothetical protein
MSPAGNEDSKTVEETVRKVIRFFQWPSFVLSQIFFIAACITAGSALAFALTHHPFIATWLVGSTALGLFFARLLDCKD